MHETSSEPVLDESLPLLTESLVIADALRALTGLGGITPETIYYPGAETDVTLTIAFDCRIILVDPNPRNVQALQQDELNAAGRHEAYLGDAEIFEPDTPVDVLILLNPDIPQDGPLKTVRPGGLIVAGNTCGEAAGLNQRGDVTLLAALHSILEPQADIDDPAFYLGTETTLGVTYTRFPKALFLFQKNT